MVERRALPAASRLMVRSPLLDGYERQRAGLSSYREGPTVQPAALAGVDFRPRFH